MSVSVVMPNYNNAPFLDGWAGPLVRDPAVSEIVVYDNGSTDGSLEMLERLGSEKLKLIRGEKNLGATLGRQEAVRASTCDLICFLDGDDFLEEGAVTEAVEALNRDQLDIVLFQCFDVDADGTNPRVTVATPDRPIDGRTACELTMGGWHIHGWGVIRKSIYQKAWEGFSVHGFLSDEVHTRRMFLAARRVGPSSGKMFYRRVPKTYDSEKMIGWGRTTVRSLALGVDARLDERAVRNQSRMTVRFMLGLTRRALVGVCPKEQVGGLLDEYFSIRPPWRVADAPWYAVDRFLRLARPLLR
ncbi:glycosyltransferase family 2 protein [Sphingomonas sp.]|uniref:glycosyltransferase family 2 protein n=1 Tax=Sphingomonas sp. TaxID=28214 RepID=UPI0017F6DA80|nr:glycosyltransferase family 2 protein [Sphingomonas sp.]MBA3511522.1 glycosyltransferase family 2 protein [Sphingomonas sp.]